MYVAMRFSCLGMFMLWGAVAQAFAAGDAVVGLADGGYGPVEAYEVSLLELGVVLLVVPWA